MATIQIRNIPEDVHRTYKRRAAAAGMSLQEYMRTQLIEHARMKTAREIVAEVEAEMKKSKKGWARVSSADIIREDRESH